MIREYEYRTLLGTKIELISNKSLILVSCEYNYRTEIRQFNAHSEYAIRTSSIVTIYPDSKTSEQEITFKHSIVLYPCTEFITRPRVQTRQLEHGFHSTDRIIRLLF